MISILSCTFTSQIEMSTSATYGASVDAAQFVKRMRANKLLKNSSTTSVMGVDDGQLLCSAWSGTWMLSSMFPNSHRKNGINIIF